MITYNPSEFIANDLFSKEIGFQFMKNSWSEIIAKTLVMSRVLVNS